MFESRNKIQKRTLGNEVPQKRKTRASRVLFYFLLLAFIAVSIYVFFFAPFLKIKKIYIQGLEELKYEKVMEDIQLMVRSKYWKLIPQDNILTIRSQEIEKGLLGKYKKIRSVKARIVFPETLVVMVEERKALLVWCSGESCYLVDERGMAYGAADFNSPEINENNLIVIRDQSQSPISIGQSIMDAEIVNFLIEVRKEIKNRLDINLEREFETPKSISGDISATTSEGWKIKLNRDLGAAKEVEMLQVVLEQNISQDRRKDLEYIDLRTADRVYYKFKNIVSEESSNQENK